MINSVLPVALASLTTTTVAGVVASISGPSCCFSFTMAPVLTPSFPATALDGAITNATKPSPPTLPSSLLTGNTPMPSAADLHDEFFAMFPPQLYTAQGQPDQTYISSTSSRSGLLLSEASAAVQATTVVTVTEATTVLASVTELVTPSPVQEATGLTYAIVDMSTTHSGAFMSSSQPLPPPLTINTASLTRLSPAMTTTSTATGDAIDAVVISACWNGASCRVVFGVVQRCFDDVGPVVDPNDRSQSAAYQSCVCHDTSTADAVSWPQCASCLQQAGVAQSILDDANTDLGDFCASEDPNIVFYIATFLSFLNDTVPQALSYHPNNALNSYGWTPPVTGAIASVTTLTTKYPNDPLANLVWGSAASGSGSFANVYPVTGIISWSSYDADKSTNVLQTGPPPLTGGIVRSTTVVTSYLTTDTATVTNVTTNATVEATSTRWVLATSSAASSGATRALAPPSLACLGANALTDVMIILSLDLLLHGLPSIVQFGLTTCLTTLITFCTQTVVLAQDKSFDVTTSMNLPPSRAVLKPDSTLVERSCNNGEIECINGGQSFSMCSNGAWIDMGNVAAGTLCRGSPGVIDYATPPVVPGTGLGGSTFSNRAVALFPPSPRALATAWMVVLFVFAASLYWRGLFLLL